MSRRKYAQLDDHDWLASNAHRTTSSIATELGCPPGKVAKRYREHGVPRTVSSRQRWTKYPELDDPELLRGRTVAEVAAEVGASPDAVREAFARHGLTPKRWYRHPELHDLEWLKANARRTTTAIARELGCKLSHVSVAFRDAGVARNVTDLEHRVKHSGLATVDRLRGRSVPEVMAETGAARSTVFQAFKRHGLRPARPPRAQKAPKGVPPPRYPELADADWLREHLHLTQAEVAQLVGCSVNGVAKAYKRADINRPSLRWRG